MYRVVIVRPTVPVPQIAGVFRDAVEAQSELERRRRANQRIVGQVEERIGDNHWEAWLPAWERGCSA